MNRREALPAGPPISEMEARFRFGENWWNFLTTLADSKVEHATTSLRHLLEVDTLEGKSFLDIGCGSGLFSLAAMRLGADRVYSFDYDSMSVQCAMQLKRQFFPEASGWTIESGDALSKDYLVCLGTFDVVYSWGVLHHTGDMWKALELAAIPVVRPGGKLSIAIYNDMGLRSLFWFEVKKLYNRLPSFLHVPYTLLFVPWFEVPLIVKNIITRRMPWDHWVNYFQGRGRGMSRWHDITDWVGGFPFEVARPEAIFEFYKSRGFRLDRLTTAKKDGNNEFVFTAL